MFSIKNRESNNLLYNLKSQATIGFLITYGWAILTILVIIGALAYVGALTPDRFVPNKCILPTGIVCLDFNIGTSKIDIVLQNAFRENIIIDSVSVAKEDGNSCSSSDQVILKNGENTIITILGCDNGDIGRKFKATLKVSYAKVGLLSRTAVGDIAGRIGQD